MTSGTSTLDRLLKALDAATAVGGVVVCGILLWNLLRPPTPPQPPPPTLPSEPISIANAPSLGSEGARLVVVAYSDFQCPFCASFATRTLPRIREDFIQRGMVRFVFKHLPLTNIHPHAVRAAEAAECARRQDRFWPLHDRLFAQTDWSDPLALRAHASAIPLDLQRFDACLKDGGVGALVQEHVAEATALGIRGTPTFYLGRAVASDRVRVTKQLSGAVGFPEFSKTLNELLNQK